MKSLCSKVRHFCARALGSTCTTLSPPRVPRTAKRRLNVLGSMLKLGQYCIDTAFNFFKLALQQNLTRGRKSSVIDTACLYLVCRSEGTPRILKDARGKRVFARRDSRYVLVCIFNSIIRSSIGLQRRPTGEWPNEAGGAYKLRVSPRRSMCMLWAERT